jgi:hypothetical protein
MKTGDVPLMSVPENLKTFILEQLTLQHPRDDCLEVLQFNQLSPVAVGLQISNMTAWKPGAIHGPRQDG